jgi:hypothetical protein
MIQVSSGRKKGQCVEMMSREREIDMQEARAEHGLFMCELLEKYSLTYTEINSILKQSQSDWSPSLSKPEPVEEPDILRDPTMERDRRYRLSMS